MRIPVRRLAGVLALAAVLSLWLPVHRDGPGVARAAARTVTDRSGRQVRVPAEPKRIACFFGPSYEKVFLLGSADRVAAMSLKQSAWAHRLNPGLKKVTVMPSYSDPDVEWMLQLGIDLVFYWQWPQQTRRMEAAGVPVVCPYRADEHVRSSGDFRRACQEEIRFYGRVLGKRAERIADAYCAYYEAKMGRIVAITDTIPEERKPTVYYITGRNAFATQGGPATAAGCWRWRGGAWCPGTWTGISST